MDINLQLLIASLPGIVIAGFLYLMVKRFIERDEKQRYLNANREVRQEVMQLRMQAYERLVLLLERSEFVALKKRLYKKDMKDEVLMYAMVRSIDSELEHNLSQQLYVTAKSWAAVRKALTDLKNMIMLAYSESGAREVDFVSAYKQKQEEEEHLSVTEALAILRNDFQQLLR